MDVWNSPPSVGLDKRKEYVVSKMKEGYELLVSPRRVRLFKVGVGYIPCAVQIFRKLISENLIVLASDEGDEAVYKLNATAKVRIEKSKPAPSRLLIDDDEDDPETAFLLGGAIDVEEDEILDDEEEDAEDEVEVDVDVLPPMTGMEDEEDDLGDPDEPATDEEDDFIG